MKAPKVFRLCILFMMIFLTAGCNLPVFTMPQGSVDVDQIRTAAAQTIEATLTMGALVESFNKPTLTSTPLPPTAEPSATPAQMAPTLTPSSLPTEAILPTNTPIPTLANTSAIPMIHSTMNTNCRSGPSSAYAVVGYLTVGDRVEVRGRNSNSTWWYIQNPADLSKYCWVWSQTTVVDGNKSIIPVITPIATVTPDVATITLSSKAVPVNFTGHCPVNIVLTAKITTDLPVKVDYGWSSNFDYPFTVDEFTFDVAGKQSFTETMVINSSTTGFLRFRITSPYLLKADRINIAVTCTP